MTRKYLFAALLLSLAAMARAEVVTVGIDQNFEQFTPGVVLDVDQQEREGQSLVHLWSGSAGFSEVVEYPAAEQTADNTQYLSFDTGATLKRHVKDRDTSAADLEKLGENAVTISSRVQFNATDDEAVDLEAGAKFAVWMYKQEDGSPQLMFTARNGAGVVTNYAVTVVSNNFTLAENTWYDLKVTMWIATANQPPVFSVTLDGAPVADAEGVQQFGSMDPSSTTYDVFVALGLMGTGAVDDIAFCKVLPDLVTLLGTCSEGVTWSIIESNGAGINLGDQVKVGDTVDLIVVAATNATVSADGVTFTYNEENKVWIAPYTVSFTDGVAGQKSFAITVTGGDPAQIKIYVTKSTTSEVTGLKSEGYVAGDTFNTTELGATTTLQGLTASLTVAVGDEEITTNRVLVAQDRVFLCVIESPDSAVAKTLAATRVKQLSAWVTAKGVDDPSKMKPAAFLLNCANTDAAIAEATAAFKVTLSLAADGSVQVNWPEGPYNGTLKKLGTATLGGAWVEVKDGEEHNYRFFKVELQ